MNKLPDRTRLRRKSAYRRAKVTPRLDLSAALVAPPLTATLWTHLPEARAVAPPAPTPVTLTVGDPAVIQVDMGAFFAEAAQFIAEHPVLCTTIAAGIILAIWACNQPSRPTHSSWS
jgi:hypothetical protein